MHRLLNQRIAGRSIHRAGANQVAASRGFNDGGHYEVDALVGRYEPRQFFVELRSIRPQFPGNRARVAA